MIKYTLPYRGHDDIAWRVDINIPAYTGTPLNVKGVSEEACVISYSGETDEPYSPIINSSAVISLLNEGQFDIKELQKAQDREVTVEVYRAGALYWKGYLIPDGIQRYAKAIPYKVSFSATDGLSLLEKLSYTHNNLPGTSSTLTRCPMNFIRQILFANSNLGIPLPIRWTNTLTNTAFPGQDVLTGGVNWSPNGEGFTTFQQGEPAASCLYILQEMMRSFQCRLYQTGGKWIIRRVNDVVTGAFGFKEIPGNLGVMTVTSGSENISKLIGSTGYKFISEDHVFTVKRGYKTVKTIYEGTTRENILPNGNMDLWVTGGLMYWGFRFGHANYTQSPGLTANSANSVKLTNPSSNSIDLFSLRGAGGSTTGLPIDTGVHKRLKFGFTFSPSTGFAFNSETGFINWETNPLAITIEFRDGVDTWYLNEFGFWVKAPTSILPQIPSMKIGDVAQVDFNKHNDILMPPIKDYTNPDTGINVFFRVSAGQSYFLDNVYITIEENNEVQEATANNLNTSVLEDTLAISSSMNGFIVSNYMTGWDRADNERLFTDGAFTGNLTEINSRAKLRFVHASSQIFNGSIRVAGSRWTFDEIYTIASTEPDKYLPLNASYNTETAIVGGLVAIECRNENITMTQKTYGTNSGMLSN